MSKAYWFTHVLVWERYSSKASAPGQQHFQEELVGIFSRALLFFPQVHNPSWLHHQSYIMPPTVSIFAKLPALLPVSLRRPHSSLFQGAVLTSGMDHSMSIHPTSMMGPLTQQLNHLSIGSSGTVSRTLHDWLLMRLLHLNSSLTNFFLLSSCCSTCLQTRLCRGPTSPSTPKCLPPTSQLR